MNNSQVPAFNEQSSPFIQHIHHEKIQMYGHVMGGLIPE